MITKEDVLRDIGGDGSEPIVLYFVDSEETLGGVIECLVPFIQAGFEHVVYSTYIHTMLCNHPIELTDKDAVNITRAISSGTMVGTDGSWEVAVYHITLDRNIL
jgi:hypothetical protein